MGARALLDSCCHHYYNEVEPAIADCLAVVWWKGGGFVCAPAAEVDEEERESRCIAERVRNARSQLAAARKERQARLAADVDIVLPADAEQPLHAGA